MFSRKEIRKAARKTVRKDFFLNIIVMFAVTLVLYGSYGYATEAYSNIELSKVGIEDFGEVMGGVKTNAEVIEDLLNAQNVIDIDLSTDTVAKRYTRGVASVFVNEITQSRSIGFGLLNGINKLVFKGEVQSSIIVFCMVLLSLFWLIFVRNTIEIGMNRYFLEERRYTHTPLHRLLFVLRHGKMKHTAGIMARRYLYQILWMCTVVMGPVKYYEYRMIPWILAENPEISSQEAFALSKKMSDGHKMEMFLLDLSLFPYLLLGAVTFNASNVFWFRPYSECIDAELYMTLRAGVSSEIFCDTLLNPDAMQNTCYPEEQYFLPLKETRRWMTIDYRKDYTLVTYILLFFTFACTGWVWEVTLHLITNGEFVNRGVLLGPWLPIYGFGGVLILFVLKPLRDHPFYTFLAAVVLCGILEYSTSVVLELVFHKMWWNYEGYFLNLNGRICLEGLLVFGLGGLGFTYVAAPLLDNLYAKLPKDTARNVAIVLVLLFLADAVHSVFHPNTGDGITTSCTENPVTISAAENC